jgi:hypothetical protein
MEQWSSEQVETFLREPEPDEVPPITPGRLTRHNLELARHIGLVAGIDPCGFELHTTRPDFAALETFMAERYGYWTDDITHPDPFAAADATIS